MRELLSGSKPWPLFCWGPPGTGKTRAALALLDYCPDGWMRELPRLCENLIDAGKDRYEMKVTDGWRKFYPVHIWAAISEAGIVVLDEIGAREKVSDFHYETLKRVLDERENKPSVYLSNLGPEQLEQLYDARIVSRLSPGVVIELAGDDRRIQRSEL